jgi:hypothetical protein
VLKHRASRAPRIAADTRTTASGSRTRFLPDNIYDGLRLFKGSEFWAMELHRRGGARRSSPIVKLAAAERCPKALGTRVKSSARSSSITK